MKVTHKLGVSRAGPASRIWLEGTRLKEWGFKCKTPFARHVAGGAGGLRLEIEAIAKSDWNNLARSTKGTVAGTSDRPIIDITGAIVSETFEGYTSVEVTYSVGKITIKGVA